MEEPSKDKEIVNNPYPQVKFALNEELNADLLNKFIMRNNNRGGANFSVLVVKAHPNLAGYDKLGPNERLDKVRAYVHEFYQKHKEDLDKVTEDINKEWTNYAPQFYTEAGKIFKDLSWPEGEYVGYLSISAPFPRFLDSKTFCVPYTSTNKAIRVAAHEMLHFIFYDYVRKRYLPDMENTIQKEMEEKLEGKFTIPLWELSEIFNIMVLSGNEWGSATDKRSATAYVGLAKYVPDLEKTWGDCDHNIDELFTRLEVKT